MCEETRSFASSSSLYGGVPDYLGGLTRSLASAIFRRLVAGFVIELGMLALLTVEAPYVGGGGKI